MRLRPLILAALGCCLGPPGVAAAQADSCELIESQQAERRADAAGLATIFIRGPLLVRCAGGAVIRARDGTLYESTREIHLTGDVSYADPERRLSSEYATYSSVTGRLYATGRVVFTDLLEGMTLRGPELEYYRAVAGRTETQAIATQRPHLTLLPRSRDAEGSSSADGEPIEVDADRMTMVGDAQFTGVGSVEIRRSDFAGFGNQAHLDQNAERMELLGNARLEGEEFDLAAERIDVFLREERLERLHAQRDAVLVGEDLRIDAPDLRLFFSEDLLQRLVARSDEPAEGAARAARPIASGRAFRLEADSIEAVLPEQRLEQVIAIGDARGESLDTTAAPAGRLTAPAPAGSLGLGDRDWIVGDTVIGHFVAVEPQPAAQTAAAADQNGRAEVELERLVARGAARSLYRVRNEQDPSGERPALSYLVGEVIDLSLRNGELEVADVLGLQRGLYLDPLDEPAAPDTGAEPASSARNVSAGSRRTRGR